MFNVPEIINGGVFFFLIRILPTHDDRVYLTIRTGDHKISFGAFVVIFVISIHIFFLHNTEWDTNVFNEIKHNERSIFYANWQEFCYFDDTDFKYNLILVQETK